MKSFAEVVAEAVRQGGFNLLFEHGMYSLMEDLQRIVTVLRDAEIPFEVVGDLAVNAHVLAVRPSRAFVTRDIDLLVNRGDLGRIVTAAEAAGYSAKELLGGFLLIRAGQQPEEAVHLLFVGEKPRSTHPVPNPDLRPQETWLSQFGISVPAAPLRDLVRMKLNSFRPKDEAHLEVLDRCGLIARDIEADLPDVLRQRLARARSRYDESEF
jgi:hypothetical protein